MVSDEEIKRINELAKKSKEVGLNEEEAKEQSELRQKYIQAVRTSLKFNLDSIRYVEDIEEEKGPKH
ncbi:DUF896 domain-containing protein [Brevibacillus sp. SYSU BS000544]|uniref:DUF896 domain-containing protein n=1 Tax=Brevibacillus sp. SYSU BS000544 TaxID=3416443 RepID=UPI003CE4DA58